MKTGAYISGAGHVAFFMWMLLGGFFLSVPKPLPVQTSAVTLVTPDELAAMSQPASAPRMQQDASRPAQPVVRDAPDAARPPAAEPDARAPAAPPGGAPDRLATPAGEAAPTPVGQLPRPAPPPPPSPSPQLSPTQPGQPAQPLPENPPVDAPPDAVAVPRPAPRVAPTAAPAPPPDAVISDQPAPEAAPDRSADTRAPDSRAAAPKEAATRIVTEAEKPASAAPRASLRPVARPKRPPPPASSGAAPAATQEAPKPAEPAAPAPQQGRDGAGASVENAVAAALAAASRATPAPAAASGPPLSSAERDALRIAVQNCWNVGSLSSEALSTTVVVGVTMQRDGRPVTDSIELLSFTGGSRAAANQAFEAARRAIVRCGAKGFDLPAEKYARWQKVEMTFNPEKMRTK